MCEGWDKSSFSAVKNQIDEALSNIVYDTNPGKRLQNGILQSIFCLKIKRDFVYILPQQQLYFTGCAATSRFMWKVW